ncbi:alpha-2-macroglobulin [Roseivirga sp. BDSF3-8]|uniref:alpha-2-macroglobulin family protein n=1 Tax=Roseivirga sp. BDSF3-8 TaxID=3241598 RepID=UPI003531EF24
MTEETHNPLSIRWLGYLLLVLPFIFNIGCSCSDNEAIGDQTDNQPPAYNAYISAYTSGMVSSRSGVQVRFTKPIADSSMIGQPFPQKAIDFSPEIDGQLVARDLYTLDFQPNNPLPNGQKYEAEVAVDELFEDAEDDEEEFLFSFQVMPQSINLTVTGIEPYEPKNLSKQKLLGVLSTADVADNEEVEKALAAFQNGERLAIEWDHTSDNAHDFIVQDVIRAEEAGKVTLKYNGQTIGTDENGQKEVEIPSLKDFKLLNTNLVQQPTQYISLRFSDPLKEDQDLRGLVTIQGAGAPRISTAGNEIRVYPSSRLTGTKTITASKGIQNILGYKLGQNREVDITFEQEKPGVRLVDDGTIIPSTEGTKFHFEAVSLNAVEISIIKIYENNIPQFLQVNSLQGNNQLRRVGQPIHKKVVLLNNKGVADLSKWNLFTVDLSEMFSAEPGALYQITLGMRKEFSAFYCEGQTSDTKTLTENTQLEEWDSPAETTYWDDYYYYPDGYSWQERDNPCHVSYYTANKHVSTNLLASNLGITAKRGEGGKKVNVAIADLRTTDPIPNVGLTVLDYQLQKIGQARTDANGLAVIKVSRTPFVLVADNNGEKGYLKMDDGSSLSLSNFEVRGSAVREGLKGFIYGERGVWRPGDSLHISFMLQDEAGTLPKEHPVVFELHNPKGQTVSRLVKNNAPDNLFVFNTTTPPDAPTGNYQAKIQVGGATFSERIRIETVKPNRLKVKVNWDKEEISQTDIPVRGTLQANWLTGPAARNMKGEMEVVYRPVNTTFSGYSNYTFDDPARQYEAEPEQFWEGTTDEDGKTQVTLDETPENPPGKMMARFSGKVYEPGGDFSIFRDEIPYSPYFSYVGLKAPEGDFRGMLLTDTSHVIDIVALNESGKPITRNVDIKLYKLNWRWWWDNTESSIGSYISNQSNSLIETASVRLTDGKGRWRFRIDYPEWGRYLVRVCDPISGHCTGKTIYLDWPGWAGRQKREYPDGAAILSFSTDKETYQVGERVRLNIPGSADGRALVSIENGTSVLKQYWVETKAGENITYFEVEEGMAPNVYAHVSLIQPHSQTANDLPIRMYGVVPVNVENPDTKLFPQLETAATFEPEKDVTVTVSEKNGRPMTYTLAVVDEGLLDLTNFPTPVPHDYFYAKEALGVKTWDVYDQVVDAMGGRTGRLLAIGGDGELNKQGNKKAQRFKPVSKFFGPFTIGSGDEESHTFRMPNYIGSVRVMVVARQGDAYGQAEKAVPVKKDLMILGTLPRVVGPGEEVSLPVTIFASDKIGDNVSLKVKTGSLLTVTGGGSKNVAMSGQEEKTVNFRLRAPDQTGIAKVQVEASGGGKSATWEIELDVRNPNPMTTRVKEIYLEPGASWQETVEAIGIDGSNSATLEVSSIPAINMQKRLQYLIRYPYGCLEQTVSKAYALLFIPKITEVTREEESKAKEIIKQSISRLPGFQMGDGSFEYWPGSGNRNDWVTSYVGHFMIEARNNGHFVPDYLLQKWADYQYKAASSYNGGSQYDNYGRSDFIQAYRLYTLALHNTPHLGAMNRLREQASLNDMSRWMLAAAYAAAGQPEAGSRLVANTNKQVADYREMSFTFGSATRDEAIILETLMRLNDKEEAFIVLKRIAEKMGNGNYWMSTQETAFSLAAIARFLGDRKPSPISFTYSHKGSNADVSADNHLITRDLGSSNPAGPVSVRNTGNGGIFVRLLMQGKPARGMEIESSNGVRLSMHYQDANGAIMDPAAIRQGENFTAVVTVSNPGTRGYLREMALTQIFPSGWEIRNIRLEGLEDVYEQGEFDYQDVRDDRVNTFFDLAPGKNKTFRVLLNATYEGEYYLPAINCEAMYDKSISATIPGKEVKVVDVTGNP